MTLRWIVFAVALLFLPAITSAQDATVNGTVTDTTGGVLPGVTVTAVHLDTGNTFSAVSDDRGNYRIPLRVGVYRVTLELQLTQQHVQQSQRRIAAARSLLATVVGQPGCPVEVAEVTGTLPKAPQYQEEAVLTAVLANSSEVLEADAAVHQAAADLRLAEAQNCGNVEVTVNPYYNFRVCIFLQHPNTFQ